MSSKPEHDSGGSPFDLDRLRELIELMEKHGLTEINLKRGEERWQLRRGPQDLMQMLPATTGVPLAVPAATVPTAAEPAPVPQPADNTIEIKSPTVGTFYAAASPDDPPFVKVGSKVQADTIVCLVEAMKVFNQIPADVSGTITEILVKNGESVEFGQSLFRVMPG